MLEKTDDVLKMTPACKLRKMLLINLIARVLQYHTNKSNTVT